MSRVASELRAVWSGFTGTGAAASIGLALLVFSCTFVAALLPRASLISRTQALQQTFAASGQLDRSVTASTLAADSGFTDPGTIDAYWQELAGNFRATGLRLAPKDYGWAGVTTVPQQLAGSGTQLELAYRSTLADNARLLSGRLPTTVVLRKQLEIIPVAVTQATAAGLHVGLGSVLSLSPHQELSVTAIIRPTTSPAAAFWIYDPALRAFNPTAGLGGAFVGAGETGALDAFLDTELSWNFPLRLGRVTVDQAPALRLDLASAGRTATSSGLIISTPLSSTVRAFIAADDGIDTVLALLFVSLTVLGMIVVLQGARLLTEHRAAEFAMMRARGASQRHLCWLALRGGAVVAVPAGAVAAAAAIAIRPGPGTALEWRLTALICAVALAGPPVLTVRQHARSRGLSRPGRRVLAARRWVADIALVSAAAGSLIVLRQLGPPPAGGVNVYASAAPALASIPAAIIAMRLYPFVLRWLLRLTRKRRGVTVFVGLARGERTALSTALPIFALVLALAIVAFAATLRTAVQRGDVLASWQDTGADAVIMAQPGSVLPATLLDAVRAVPGVQRTATAVIATGSAGQAYSMPIVVLDPARYAALVAGTPEPPFPAAGLARPAAGRAVPVLVSGPARALLGQAGGQQIGVEGRTLTARVAGVVPALAVVPGGGAFVVVPSWSLPPAPPTSVVIVGSRLDGPALAAAVRHGPAPAPSLLLRSAQLAALASAPLPRSAYFTSLTGLAATAGFSVISLLLGLVLGARSRDLTQARLSTMGISRRQARLLGVVESVPAIIVASAGGIGCVLVLTPLLGPAISLAAFTGPGVSAPFRANGLALAGSAAGLIALAVVTIIIQVGLASRRGVARALRVGE